MKTCKKIGFTTSMPVEVLFAAGHIPVDINNILMSGDPVRHIRQAELKGFPRTVCTWIKGNYATALSANLDEVVGVIQGDCSNTHSLLMMLSDEGIPVTFFSFPPQREDDELNREITKLEERYEVSRNETEKVKQRLDGIRRKLRILDDLTWKERLVTGRENHWWLINSSDFMGDPDGFEERLDAFLDQVRNRDPLPHKLRIGYLGVPPIYLNLYDTITDLGGDVLFNEVQRQFAMPALESDIVQQYLTFTYPYSVFDRLHDIQTEILKRGIDAVIGYTQSFCHLQIDNILLKKYIDLPFLTLEGDQPEIIDQRTLLRLESFFEVHTST